MSTKNLSRKALLTERGYSTNEVIEYAKKSDVWLVIHLYKRTVNHNANAMQKIPSRQKNVFITSNDLVYSATTRCVKKRSPTL